MTKYIKLKQRNDKMHINLQTDVKNSPLCSRPVIVTGVAGFIGFFTAKYLLDLGIAVVGIDNINDYYDISLKHARLSLLRQSPNFVFHHKDIADKQAILDIFTDVSPKGVIHLAAQAGVRYCIQNPDAYVTSNLVGFMSILEAVRKTKPEHVLYASSSSVYGHEARTPFSTDFKTDKPVSLYAATKKANELLAYSYADMYHLPLTGLRFFTVYGALGRPDMAYFKFTQAILAGEPIKIFNHGDMLRDFTYIDDIIEGIMGIFIRPPEDATLHNAFNQDKTPHNVFNIGHNHPEKLMDMIEILEDLLGKKAIKEFLPMQVGDVYATFADIEPLSQLTSVRPTTVLREGLAYFISWYKSYYEIY